MRKSCLLTLIGATLVAIVLVVATTIVLTSDEWNLETLRSAPAGGEELTEEIDDVLGEQLAALEDSLGLDTEEVLALLEQQEEAASLADDLRTELDDTFGGAVFDSATGTLTVQVTEEAAAAEVEQAGAEPELVTHAEHELTGVLAQLDDTEPVEGVTSWYIDVPENTVVIETLPEAAEDGAEVLTAAGIDQADATGSGDGAVQVIPGAQQPELFDATAPPDGDAEQSPEQSDGANVVGGAEYQAGLGLCSVGFAVEGGFVTAGHCGTEGTPTVDPDGVVAGAEFPDADMGWVDTDAAWTPSPWVMDYQPDNGAIAITGAEEAPVGAEVCRSGGTTGWHCGTIKATNETVHYPEGTVHGLTRTSACAEPGDSGGSWLAGTQAQGVTSGGSGDCVLGGTTYFQPLNPILDEWNLELLTNDLADPQPPEVPDPGDVGAAEPDATPPATPAPDAPQSEREEQDAPGAQSGDQDPAELPEPTP
ncbi:S1 family peptidase [Lipingzhangella sp. LS1_29]|uniref:S1 family peptidase n=1 Tax=Lipingzhangella rawalii TaxID=2055835 RepID=A0ABU2H9Y4_9ACTN|nr:S1 family peptidase [Lipingzhangella rawalii]MDS1272091.1 S1 family peptidase [Lipingzhangella rawalii]